MENITTIQLFDIDWNEHIFQLQKWETITDHAENLGIELPYSCRSWACFVCAANVEKWKEFLLQETWWTKIIDTDEDEVLTCICWVNGQSKGEWVDVVLRMLN